MFRMFILLLLGVFATFVGQAQVLDTLVDVGTHQLHFKIVKGHGVPILFESGNNDDGTVWEQLLDSLHQTTGTTLITYDRAGLGKSGIDTTSIDFRQEVIDLQMALKQLGYQEELFLVSHSFGAFYATQLSIEQENRIQGAVFIDPAVPCFFTEEWARSFVKTVPPEYWAIFQQEHKGLYYVLQDFPGICAYMADRPIPETIPVTLIAAEKMMPTIKPEEVEHWKACLNTFGSQPNHRYVFAEDCAHRVWADNPKLVLEVIIQSYRASMARNK